MVHCADRASLALLLALCAVAAACSRTEGPAPPPAPAVQDAGIDTLEGADTAPKSSIFTGVGVTYLTDVRIARHEGYDRVVFEFVHDVPGYALEYVKPPVLSDGAGEPVQVAGNFFLQVRLTPASGVDILETEPRPTYTGPARIPGVGTVREVVRIGDFEAYLTWAIGLEDRVDFRVQRLATPSRLVIDFRNH